MSSQSLYVLVVDDCPDIRRFLQHCLIQAGHSVVCAENGQAAIRHLQVSPFDAVVTDIVMPDGDGLELITYARRHHPDTRILAISAGGWMLHPEYCLLTAERLGAHAVLRKPFGRPELLEAIERVRPVKQAPAAAELVGRSKGIWRHRASAFRVAEPGNLEN